MMRVALGLSALALAACSQPAPQALAADAPECSELELTGELNAAECRLEASGQTMHVLFGALPAGVQAGAVTVNVIGERGQIAQTLVETDVFEYHMPSIEDVDGDGRGDILIPRVTGNVNTEWGVWVYSGERQHYERAGDISGVEIERTADGYLAVPARSSAASWNVRYYRLDESGLHHLVTAQIDGEAEAADGSIRSSCTIPEAPGLAELNMSQRAAEEKFCAEPASQVFAP
jgi:hypothetical protein